jgi:hypothetical protein
MRQVGKRREAPISERASGLLLLEGARFNEAIAHLAPSTFVRKGIYRFKTHEAMNQHQQDCLVAGMARLAAERA